jgi:voltage-gated potassium channel
MSIRSARRFFYDLLVTPEKDMPWEKAVRVGLESVIAISVLLMMLQTDPAIDARFHEEFAIFELFAVMVFTLEYLLRFWCAGENPKYRGILGRLRYMVSPLALIDLIAILPFYLPMLVRSNLIPLRALRLIRLMRILKLGRYTASLNLISRVVKKKRHEIAMALVIVMVLLLMSSTLMYYIEHDAQPEAFSSIPKSLWWGVATLTTIGYGDIYPITALGRACVGFIAILGIGVFALPSGVLVAGFLEEIRPQEHLCDRCKQEISSK